MNAPPKPLRILMSEGSSTSAREVITILGLAGHHVEVCDPSLWCLARYSRFARKFHRCPGLRADPAGYLRFVENLLAAQHFDVLLPAHEQGFLFARVAGRLKAQVGLALPGFHAYGRVAAGIGGGGAFKKSVSRPLVRGFLEQIGRHLDWPGALWVDYIMPIDSATPLLIDCNPRLVEPFNAHSAGTDLVET